MSRLKFEILPDSSHNMLLKYYNEFILATTKRHDGNYNMEFIKYLTRMMDAPRPRQVIDVAVVNEVKDKAFESLLYHINLENNLYSHNYFSTKYEFQRKTSFKAYVCRGNNGKVIKTILKKRWWWTLADKCDTED